ncbi:MAG: MBG domain-containing protein [Bacteroidota bacterium]
MFIASAEILAFVILLGPKDRYEQIIVSERERQSLISFTYHRPFWSTKGGSSSDDDVLVFSELDAVSYGDGGFDINDFIEAEDLDLSYMSEDESVASFDGSMVIIEGAGATTIIVTGLDIDGNPVASAQQELIVSQAQISIKADESTKVYGSTDPILTYEIVEGQLFPGDDFSGSLSRDGGEDVGVYGVNLGTLSVDENYQLNLEESTFSITPRPITISPVANQSKDFGEDDPNLNFEVLFGSLAPGDDFDGHLQREEGENVGDYEIRQGSLMLNDNYELTYVEQVFRILKATQNIILPEIVDQVPLRPPFPYAGILSSGLPITYDVQGPATFSNDTLKLTGVLGLVTITASQLGNANFLPASPVSVSFEVITTGFQPQTVNFPTIVNKQFGDAPFVLLAGTSSGLPVFFTVDGPAFLEGNLLNITGAGEVTITALQPGDTSFAPAENTQQLNVMKRNQTIEIPVIDNKLTDDEIFNVNATVNSELTLVYEILGPALVDAAGNVSLTGESGEVFITVRQPGDENHNEAPPQTASFLVSDAAKQDQTIIFAEIGTQPLSQGTLTLEATSTSGLSVTYELVEGPASLVNGVVTLISVGTVTIRARQPGNNIYNPASPVTRTFTIGQAGQVITFNPVGNKVFGDEPFTLSATASSGLAVNFEFVSGPILIEGDRVTIIGAGSATVRVSQPGNEDYTPADPLTRTFSISKADQDISIPVIDDKIYGDPDFTLSATSTSGLPVEFEVVNGSAQLTNDSLRILGAGQVNIRVSQSGDGNYNETFETTSFTVAKATLNVSVADSRRAYGEPNPGFSLTYDGFINNDSEQDIVAPTGLHTAVPSSPVNNDTGYLIGLSGGSSDDYEFQLISGRLFVDKAILTANARDAQRQYGQNNPDLAIDYDGFVLGESEVDIVRPTITTVANASSPVGSYDLILSGGSASNYDLFLEPGVLTINKADLNVEPNSASMVYGAPLPELSLNYRGFVNNDDQSDISVPMILTDVTSSTPPGIYPLILNGGSATNYELIFNEGDIEVTRAQLTVSANDYVISFDGEIPELLFAYEGFVNNEDVSDLDIAPQAFTSATKGSDVGVYPIELVGGTSDRYNFEYINGSLTIEKREATIIIDELEQILSELGNTPTVTTEPEGLNISITYDGLPNVPTEEGQYEVVVSIDETNYRGMESAVLVLSVAVNSAEDLPETVITYPNPTSGWLYFQDVNHKITVVRLYDLNGQLKLEKTGIAARSALDITTFQQGVYLLILLGADEKLIDQRLVIKH